MTEFVEDIKTCDYEEGAFYHNFNFILSAINKPISLFMILYNMHSIVAFYDHFI